MGFPTRQLYLSMGDALRYPTAMVLKWFLMYQRQRRETPLWRCLTPDMYQSRSAPMRDRRLIFPCRQWRHRRSILRIIMFAAWKVRPMRSAPLMMRSARYPASVPSWGLIRTVWILPWATWTRCMRIWQRHVPVLKMWICRRKWRNTQNTVY